MNENTSPTTKVEDPNNVVVQVENLQKKYQIGKVIIHALNDISFEIEKGSFAIFVGESGCGKTTTLNLIGGLTDPTAGILKIQGQKITDFSDSQLSKFRSRHIGFIFQDFNLIDVYDTYENVAYPLYLLGVPRKKRMKLVLEMLDNVGMKKYLKHKPTELSGGQKQRVAIARALIKNPQIILADEPTANLDSKTSTTIMELMVELNKKLNATFIIATHSPSVMKYASTLFQMEDGKLVNTNRIS